MKAITVQQPWAWAIIHGGKNVENRTRIGTWRAAVGTTIAIHAGQRVSDRGMNDQRVGRALRDRGHVLIPQDLFDGALGQPLAASMYMGAVLGLVDVEDVHPSAGCCSPWGEQSYLEHGPGGDRRRLDVVHLVLANPRPLEVPMPCRGVLGLWTVPEHVAGQLEPVRR